MYPVLPTIGAERLPPDATYWMPDDANIEQADDDDDLDDGWYEAPDLPGIGCFQETWRIVDATIEEAAHYLATERRMAKAIALLARDASHFDLLADTVEGGYVGSCEQGLTPREQTVLGDFAWDVPPELASLEIGVVGLTYALNAIGMVTAASCRGHTDEGAWSSAPVVAFASTETLAHMLQPLAARSGCTFFIDSVRPELLVVCGRSVLDTMKLAEAVIEASGTFDPRDAGVD